jgi:hypothetical protein
MQDYSSLVNLYVGYSCGKTKPFLYVYIYNYVYVFYIMYIMHVCARVISHSLSLRHLCVFSVHCCFFHHGDCCFHFLLITFSGFTHICAIHIFLFHVLLYRKPCTFLRNIIIWGFPVNFKCSLKTNPLNSVIGHTHFGSGCSLD